MLIAKRGKSHNANRQMEIANNTTTKNRNLQYLVWKLLSSMIKKTELELRTTHFLLVCRIQVC